MEVLSDRYGARSGTTPLHICVFCGARPGSSAKARMIAREVGGLIGVRGHRLIYGCGGGMMAEVAEAAEAAGAGISGVIPQFLRSRERGQSLPRQQIRYTDSLLQRKSIMLRDADAFLALPGGFGTLDEMLEVITLNQLGVLRKPLVILNADGLWKPFLDLIAELTGAGFIGATEEQLYEVADTAAEALELIEQTHRTQQERSKPCLTR